MHVSKLHFWLSGTWRGPEHQLVSRSETLKTMEEMRKTTVKRTFSIFSARETLSSFKYIVHMLLMRELSRSRVMEITSNTSRGIYVLVKKTTRALSLLLGMEKENA